MCPCSGREPASKGSRESEKEIRRTIPSVGQGAQIRVCSEVWSKGHTPQSAAIPRIVHGGEVVKHILTAELKGVTATSPGNRIIELIHMAGKVLGDHTVSDAAANAGTGTGWRTPTETQGQKPSHTGRLGTLDSDRLTNVCSRRIPRCSSGKDDMVPSKPHVVDKVRCDGSGPITNSVPNWC